MKLNLPPMHIDDMIGERMWFHADYLGVATVTLNPPVTGHLFRTDKERKMYLLTGGRKDKLSFVQWVEVTNSAYTLL